jgi:HPt (histidine-containing phosphotransfer) domain-containing protein
MTTITELAWSTDSSIVDLGALTERVGGDTDLISEIVQIFLDRYPEAIARVREAIIAGLPKNLESAAHHLRGYLVSLHANRASAAAQELETKGRAGDITDTRALLETLEREMDILILLLASLSSS